MKLQFKHQQFQADAARAVCDVFLGQPHVESSYIMDPGKDALLPGMDMGWNNAPTMLPGEAILCGKIILFIPKP